MKLKIKSNFSFSKLASYVKSEKFNKEQSKLVGPPIVESSKKFIREGKVRPDIKQITKDIKRRRGSPTPNIPLMDTGNLVNSLKATTKGIIGASYGKKHLEGDGITRRNFIHVEEDKIKKPLSRLIDRMNKVMKK
tara:strand:+ start:131 stop:535 length:405 start_codon:yes stop_codon:yes gene_type:complete